MPVQSRWLLAASRLHHHLLFRLLLLLLLHVSGSVEVMVRSRPGDDVLLPCVFTGVLKETVTVFWRDQDDRNVLDIRRSREDRSSQDQVFRGRVSSWTDLYRTGNFSILLKDVRKTDAGPYDCNIPAENFKQDVTLTVSGERVQQQTPPPPPGASGGGTAVTPTLLLLFLFLFSSSCLD